MAPPSWQGRQLQKLVLEYETAVETLVFFGAALAVALAGGVYHCIQYHECADAHLCTNASRGRPYGLSCSYVNYVSIGGDVAYGVADGALVSLTQGVCAPGERMHINSVSGSEECAPWYPWPDALDDEIMDAGAGTYHDQACGKWIEAGGSLQLSGELYPEYYSFYDEDATSAAIKNAEAAVYTSARLSGGDLGKFYTTCVHTVMAGSGAIRAAGKLAYAHLIAPLAASTEREALESLGWLLSHACEGPVLLGTSLGSGGYQASAVSGTAFDEHELAEVLFSVEEDETTQMLAEQASAYLRGAVGASATTIEQYEMVFEGAVGRTDHDNVVLAYRATPYLDRFIQLQTAYESKTLAYLKGVAAVCSFALERTLTTELGAVNARDSADLRSADLPNATALGRLSPPIHDPFPEVDNGTELQASLAGWSSLYAQPLGDAQSDCSALTRFVFPDRVDQEHFDIAISRAHYDRLEELIEIMRVWTRDVVLNAPEISGTMTSPEAVAAAIEGVTMRVAGAPRYSWGGIPAAFPDSAMSSDDGVLLSAVKQARAVFLDRMSRLVFDSAPHCAGPPVYDALVGNAYAASPFCPPPAHRQTPVPRFLCRYIYPSALCSYLLLGVLRRPFSDERYDNASIASRIGWVISHELAHTTLVTSWLQTPMQTLLHRYPQNQFSEAIADVIGALAVIRSGMATAAEVCMHTSQLWCAREPIGYRYPADEASHPGPNERGDDLCGTLADLGYSV